MDKFNKIITEIFKMPAKNIRDSLTAKEIPNWDSMNYLLFISETEKVFGVTFDMNEVLEANSIGDIKRALRSKGINI